MTTVSVTWDGEDAGEVEDPSPEDLERMIQRLDGRSRTIVMLTSDAGCLAVGGSATEGLVVYADLGDNEFWSARSPDSTSPHKVIVVAGGQPGDHPARLVTTFAVAVAAATTFLRSGMLSDQVEWEQREA